MGVGPGSRFRNRCPDDEQSALCINANLHDFSGTCGLLRSHSSGTRLARLLLMRSARALSELVRTRTARLCALSLVVLVTLPFTAPFATLNWADFVSSGRARRVVTSVDASVASCAQNDDADDVTASDVCVRRVHAFRFCELAPVTSPVAGDPLASAVSILSDCGTSPSARSVSALGTILRL